MLAEVVHAALAEADNTRLRDVFAVVAMHTLIARATMFHPNDIAKRAYDISEAMLAEKKRRDEADD